MFSFRTTNIPKVKALVDALKEIMIETNLQFCEQGIDICKINSQGSVCCTVHLDSEKLNNENNISKFACDFPTNKPYVIGVNLLLLAKILRSIPQKSTLKLEVDRQNNNKLKIIILTDSQLVDTTYHLSFIEIDQQSIDFPADVEYDAVLEIDSKYLQKQIKDINQMDVKVIEMKYLTNQFVLMGNCGFMSRETNIYQSNEAQAPLMKIISKNDQIYQGRFATKDLLSICKFMYLSDKYILKLKNDFPLVLIIEVENLGTVTLIITPMDEDMDI